MEIKEWDLIISPKKKWFDLQINEIWRYRDLLFLFVKRDVVAFYKQTILGPIWYFIQPIFTTIIFTFIFGNLANLSTDNIPQPLFYLTGITAWNYFADCLTKTSTVFKDNSAIFGKVYFPRVIMPLSIVLSNLVRFIIQFLLLLFLIIYYYSKGSNFSLSWQVLLLPYYILLIAVQGLGLGMIVSALTTKYRDLSYLLVFGVQLLMYATTVIYPLSSLKGRNLQIVSLNPMTYIIEAFRKIILGTGHLDINSFLYSSVVSFTILFLGVVIFTRVEKSFVDTI